MVINEWNKQSNDCVNASRVNMFKNRLDIISDKGWLYKHKILATCHLELVIWGGNVIKYCHVKTK